MNDAGPRFWGIYFEVYESLPRQGPGNRDCAARALGLCRELQECPAILDPTMGRLNEDLAAVRDSGFELVGHFTLPDEAWWDDFYTPMEARIAGLGGNYANDVEALAVLDQLAEEPEMHRRYSEFFAYEFFVARRPFHSRGPR
jgi:hypothetical protein